MAGLNIPGIREIGYLYVAYAIVIAAIHLFFAVGVFIDSLAMKRSGGATFLVPGFIWMLATLVGGVIPAGIYWVIHHSALRSARPPWVPKDED